MDSLHLPDSILQCWTHTSRKTGCLWVLPDGCRDLILRTVPGHYPEILLSALDEHAYSIGTLAETHYVGFRLHPAARFEENTLRTAAAAIKRDETSFICLLSDLVQLDRRLEEALAVLSSEPDIHHTSRLLGVSERTLERLIGKGTGRTPTFWKSLVRLRRTAKTLCKTVTRPCLADIAVEHGYADQAHMNRVFRRWLGVTPLQFHRSTDMHAALMPGFD